MVDKKRLGERIRARRLELGLTMREAAERCGVDHSMIGHLEKGEKNPTIDTLAAIAQGLEVDLSIDLEPQGSQVPKERQAIIDRAARVIPILEARDLDMLVHMMSLWERQVR